MGCTTKVRIWPWPNGKGNDLHVRWKADFESVRQQPEVNLAAPVGVLSLGQLCAQIFNCVPVARYAKSLLFPSMSCSGLPARASNLFHFFFSDWLSSPNSTHASGLPTYTSSARRRGDWTTKRSRRHSPSRGNRQMPCRRFRLQAAVPR